MRIKNTGTVTVTADEVVVEGFTFDGCDGETMMVGSHIACEWATKRLREALDDASRPRIPGRDDK